MDDKPLQDISKAYQTISESRIDVKVTLADGNSWVTGFNGTLDEAKKYFLGQKFYSRSKSARETEVYSKAIKVDLIS